MIGITGGIASGKSAVAQRLSFLGAVVLDADHLARQVLEPQTPGWEAVKETFPEVIKGGGSIDRGLLADIIFADASRRRQLEEIVHPLVLAELLALGEKWESKGKIVFAEVPLLYEVGWDVWMDEVWVVSVDGQTQMERLLNRSKIGAEQARRMIASQMPLEEKAARAARVIDNNGSLIDTWKQVDSFWQELCSERCP